jgi:hypothetical protein
MVSAGFAAGLGPASRRLFQGLFRHLEEAAHISAHSCPAAQGVPFAAVRACNKTIYAPRPSTLDGLPLARDTRVHNGLVKDKLSAGVPQTFTVRGRGGVPTTAKAVTGNVTVVNSSSAWAVYMGPVSLASPTTSTINFTKGQVRANSLTVALSPTGTLSVTFLANAGNTTDLVFDVTGYYTADLTGAKYVAITPVPLLDTRSANGLSGKFVANTPRSVTLRGRGGVPTNATGITGVVSVFNQTNSWAVFVGPTQIAKPTTSALNFLKGDNCSNGLTVALSGTGTLGVTYMAGAGNTTNVVIFVTGYFVP